MNDDRFDLLVKAMATPSSRRRALGGLVGGVLVAGIGPRRAAQAGVVAQQTWTRTQIIQIIYRAADRWGQPRADMLRAARGESNLNPNAVNPAGPWYGLFQFHPDTFASTPYRHRDIFDPRYNAYAAAWMWAQGRRNEWACQ